VLLVACNADRPSTPSSLLPSSTAAAATETPAHDPAGGSASATRLGKRTPGAIFVSSTRLYYDTFVVVDPLPMERPFQLLEAGVTEFGPGVPHSGVRRFTLVRV